MPLKNSVQRTDGRDMIMLEGGFEEITSAFRLSEI